MAELAGIGQYKTVDPKFVRSAKAEADAIKAGMTKEYIESRGGVNASGYYGDSWSAEKNLSDAEYAAIVAKGGNVGAAINAATDKKQGITGSSIGGSTGGNTGGSTGKTYTAPDGRIFTDLAAYNAYIDKTAADEKTRKGQSAYDLLFAEFDRYGMGSLVDAVKGFVVEGLSKDELTLRLRATPAYEKRFAANAQRIKKGFRSISEAEYVGLCLLYTSPSPRD